MILRSLCSMPSDSGMRGGFGIIAKYVVPVDVPQSTRLAEALCLLDPKRFPTMSQARSECRKRHVIVNGEPATTTTLASPGDTVDLQRRIMAAQVPPLQAPPFELKVLYEDDSLAVVYKPEGVHSHAGSSSTMDAGITKSDTMAGAVRFLKPSAAGTIGAYYRPKIVHRLDQPTSGLMMVAKTKPAHVALMWRGLAIGKVTKRYAAIVCGNVQGDEGVIDAPIGSQAAETHWKVTARARSSTLGGSHLTELALYPKTGRQHRKPRTQSASRARTNALLLFFAAADPSALPLSVPINSTSIDRSQNCASTAARSSSAAYLAIRVTAARTWAKGSFCRPSS